MEVLSSVRACREESGAPDLGWSLLVNPAGGSTGGLDARVLRGKCRDLELGAVQGGGTSLQKCCSNALCLNGLRFAQRPFLKRGVV